MDPFLIEHRTIRLPSHKGNPKKSVLRMGLSMLALVVTLAAPARAASLADPNLFNGKTVAVSSTFGNTAFAASNLVDGTNRAHIFADSQPTALVSISGFNSAIGTLRFFDTPSYDARVATGVSIYASPLVTNSLSAANYSLVGSYNFVTRNIVTTSSTHDGYTIATSPVEHPRAGDPASMPANVISYHEFTGLAIPAGTRSIFFNFTEISGTFGAGLTEIQAFAPVPEAGSWVLVLLGGGACALRRRRD